MVKINLQNIDKNLIRSKRGSSPSSVAIYCLGLKPDEAVAATDIAQKLSLSLDMVQRKLKESKCRLYLPNADNSKHVTYGAHPDTVAKYIK